MKKRQLVYLLSLIVALSFVINACTHEPQYLPANPNKGYNIDLRWNKAYDGESVEKIETGLKWAFSFLGANLPRGSFETATSWERRIIHIDFEGLGFSEQARYALAQLIAVLKTSEEYKTLGGIDIGRFIMLTLNSSNHYYAITGADDNLTAYRSQFTYDSMKVAIIESAISNFQRKIEIGENNLGAKIGFDASEGHGSIFYETFHAEEHEVFDIMPNGQLRFALYGANGKLTTVAEPSLSNSGKPAKCLWCHEIRIQPPFKAQTAVAGYYSPEVFKSIVQQKSSVLDAYRNTLQADIDFKAVDDHTFAELLYISFMEPSAERLSLEWNMSVADVKAKLASLSTHVHPEFPFLGNLYNRKDIDPLSPYAYIPVPESAREKSVYEPDLIR